MFFVSYKFLSELLQIISICFQCIRENTYFTKRVNYAHCFVLFFKYLYVFTSSKNPHVSLITFNTNKHKAPPDLFPQSVKL